MIITYLSYLFIQPPGAIPETSDTLLNWALGVLVVLVGSCFTFLVNYINKKQAELTKKDDMLISLTRDLSERNEKYAELMTRFTTVMLDHTNQLEKFSNVLIKVTNERFEAFSTDFEKRILNIIIQAQNGEFGKTNKGNDNP